ncbi:hypothetical protein C5167_006942 [Papaver somniferum]|uniref:Uncharacterized protein n=1 Tax=Papaver somniferum TaxID=3469 RepID=A0A4Y7JHX5_PAPSO|nr:hypothetical protein C5167_006942 [Papaver somniferum]
MTKSGEKLLLNSTLINTKEENKKTGELKHGPPLALSDYKKGYLVKIGFSNVPKSVEDLILDPVSLYGIFMGMEM